jgi:hypothetical protein
MNRYVHFDLTRAWALQTGFDPADADIIAQSNLLVDSRHKWRVLCNAKWHTSLKFAYKLFHAACKEQSLTKLGQSLHVIQDYSTHRHGLKRLFGVTFLNPRNHFDSWNDPNTPEEIKSSIEHYSLLFLREYKSVV